MAEGSIKGYGSKTDGT